MKQCGNRGGGIGIGGGPRGGPFPPHIHCPVHRETYLMLTHGCPGTPEVLLGVPDPGTTLGTPWPPSIQSAKLSGTPPGRLGPCSQDAHRYLPDCNMDPQSPHKEPPGITQDPPQGPPMDNPGTPRGDPVSSRHTTSGPRYPPDHQVPTRSPQGSPRSHQTVQTTPETPTESKEPPGTAGCPKESQRKHGRYPKTIHSCPDGVRLDN